MFDSFAFRRFGVFAAAVLALALSACGGGGGGGSAAELAAAPASAGGAAPVDGRSAAAGAPPGAGEGAGSPPVEERLSVEPGAGEPEPGGPVGEGPGEGGPAAPGGGSAASPSAAAWHVFGEVGTGGNGAAPVTAEDLSNISANSLFQTAVNFWDYAGTSFASDGSGVGRQGLPNISRSNAWRRQSMILLEADEDEYDSYYDDWLAMGSQDRDSMRVRVGHNAAGQVSYSLNYREQLNPKSPTDTYKWTLDSEAAGANVRRLGSGGRQGALLRREDSAGSLWAAVATDISGRGDTDWLATGVWAYRPADGAGSGTGNRDWQFVHWPDSRSHPGWSEYRFGVFADGGDPFRASDLAELTGTATYEGGASGVYGRDRKAFPAPSYEEHPGVIYPEWLVDVFTADATLTVDFSAKPGADGEGAVTGRIHNMRIGGRPIIEAMAGGTATYKTLSVLAGANPEITLSGGVVSGVDSYTMIEPGHRDGYAYLGSATMTTRAVNTFYGRDSSVFVDETWRGNWEGAFFGNPAPGAAGADRLPGSVAGAFGVQRGITVRDYIVGAFAAHRTGWTDAPEGVRQ